MYVEVKRFRAGFQMASELGDFFRRVGNVHVAAIRAKEVAQPTSAVVMVVVVAAAASEGIGGGVGRTIVWHRRGHGFVGVEALLPRHTSRLAGNWLLACVRKAVAQTLHGRRALQQSPFLLTTVSDAPGPEHGGSKDVLGKQLNVKSDRSTIVFRRCK